MLEAIYLESYQFQTIVTVTSTIFNNTNSSIYLVTALRASSHRSHLCQVGTWRHSSLVTLFKAITHTINDVTDQNATQTYHICGESKGFSIYETDDMNQLTNTTVHCLPEMKWKFMPIHESSEVAELYLKSKK